MTADAKAPGRLFLFHYATGDAESLLHLTAALPPHVAEVWAFEYPAHGARAQATAPPVRMPSIAALVEEQVAAVAPLLLDKPCVFYGHSFGSHVAFVLAQRLWALALPLPCLLIASGRFPPHVTSPLRQCVAPLASLSARLPLSCVDAPVPASASQASQQPRRRSELRCRTFG
jgi:surfactin synthase thioesterase subunit